MQQAMATSYTNQATPKEITPTANTMMGVSQSLRTTGVNFTDTLKKQKT